MRIRRYLTALVLGAFVLCSSGCAVLNTGLALGAAYGLSKVFK